MISRYVHCVDDDVIDATIEKNGTPIPKPQVKSINPAQAVSIVDAASTIAKVNAENEALKAEMETMKAMFNEDAIKAMIEKRVSELMKRGYV